MSFLTLDDFDYDLPPALIAQTPAVQRRASRLLHLCNNNLTDRQFTDLPSLLRPNDLLVFNNTKVLKARLFGEKSTGGKVEILVERIVNERQVWAHLRASKSPKAGSVIRLANAFDVTVLGRTGDAGDLFDLQFPDNALTLLDQYGQLPLPPYISHQPDEHDDERYQTVYAEHLGAVAAPTAGLHFDTEMLAQLQAMGVQAAFVTLHVGAGTFLPVRTQNLAEHVMHSEWYQVEQTTVDAIAQTKAQGGRVIAVGTTSVRALESAAKKHQPLQASADNTQLFITPGFEFKVIDAMITNFHLPKSTLLMLISAFAGQKNIRLAYEHAVANQYRFFSYGDAMLIERG